MATDERSDPDRIAADLDPNDPLWSSVRPDSARRLLLAALRCFAAKGFHATTTRDIALSAGMSSAALYVHFPSKADVLFQLSQLGHQDALRVVEECVRNGGGSPTVRVRSITHAFVAWHARNHMLARVVQYEMGGLDRDSYRRIAMLRRRIEELIRAEISSGIADGTFYADDLDTSTRVALSVGIDVARWYSPRYAPPEVLGEQFAELILRMLSAAPSPMAPQRSDQAVRPLRIAADDHRPDADLPDMAPKVDRSSDG